MARSITYADALRVLGEDNTAVKALDKIFGGALLGAATAGFTDALGLIDGKIEAFRLCQDLVNALRDKLAGLGRYSRTQRLEAAHAIIVLAAFFEAIDHIDLPFTSRQLELSRKEVLEINDLATSKKLVVNAILDAHVLVPEMHLSYEENLSILRQHYRAISASLMKFLMGLKIWDSLNATDRDEASLRLLGELPDYACVHYQELYRRLGADFPEFEIWANMGQHQSTRDVIHKGMAKLENRLADLITGLAPTRHLLSISNANRSALTRPINAAADLQEGLQMPTLAAGYVNPGFRVVEPDAKADITSHAWWQTIPAGKDLSDFLAGFLTSPRAVEIPLVVLGQPGAGKSLLMRVLAARLPPDQFLPIRITLRQVPADVKLQAQIKHALCELTHEEIDWADLARSAAESGILPVLLLDGLDELVQSIGVHRNDFLEQVSEFQQCELEQGRAVAAIVTTRTAVAHRCRLPKGAIVAQLDPFSQEQITTWLATWNSVNEEYFLSRDLHPLHTEDLLPQIELAAEPLLLLMLALYDADANDLKRNSRQMARAELYHRVLSRFAEREIRKRYPHLSGEQLAEAVHYELRRLGVVAFSMINRSQQWATREEIDQDLMAWQLAEEKWANTDFRASLSAAERVVAGFFFVHQSRSIQNDKPLAAYEFLHATFGEYLAALLVFEVIKQLRSEAAASSGPFGEGAPQAGPLYALTSFALMSTQRAMLGFLRDMAGTDGTYSRLITRCFRNREQRTDLRFSTYLPRQLPIVRHLAYYSANLALLTAVLVEEMSIQDLLGIDGDPIEEWRRLGFLWQSAATNEEWVKMIQILSVRRHKDSDIRVVFGDAEIPPEFNRLQFAEAPDPRQVLDEMKRLEKRFLLDDSPYIPSLLSREETLGYISGIDHSGGLIDMLLYDIPNPASAYQEVLDQFPALNDAAARGLTSIIFQLLVRDISSMTIDTAATLVQGMTPRAKSESDVDTLIACVLEVVARDSRRVSLLWNLTRIRLPTKSRLRLVVTLIELGVSASDIPQEILKVADSLTSSELEVLQRTDPLLFHRSRRVIQSEGRHYGIEWP
ncbi:hypothetical protein AB0K18_10370 [Nonomuraea sp. NPDC049421]|uniref:NACHT domain-containing protein n=1 Tax=Nonomuraea sp. NPDC049421 TaxID=3155275 RepID=UPI003447CEEA